MDRVKVSNNRNNQLGLSNSKKLRRTRRLKKDQTFTFTEQDTKAKLVKIDNARPQVTNKSRCDFIYAIKILYDLCRQESCEMYKFYKLCNNV